jgi:DEAD/DEAH box helicase domain-containing protein
MLPSVIASELEQVAADAIRTAFHPTTPGFAGLIDRFLADRQRLVKGPYVSIALPFHKCRRGGWFPELPQPFPPWRHQELAFQRLSPGSPQNTLVATGTGSGKTEAFLYPCLEHCRLAQLSGQRGVKVILIYPMNALATDQAKRIARLIHTLPALAGLRAGLYIGDQEEQSAITMGTEQVITDRDTLHKAPPDLLLTNYKQLDYLLLQPHVQGLWAHNGQGVLRYLVVDEFHTFDGAQGTDLACLIRRLRDRLHCTGEELICVGTSATLGDADSQAEMLHYAGQIFGSGFDRASLIQEDRLTPAEFFEETAFADDEQGLLVLPPPSSDQQALLDPATYGTAGTEDLVGDSANAVRLAYLAAQVPLWFGSAFSLPASGDLNELPWRIELGRQMGRLPAVQNLVRQAHKLCSLDELLERFARQLGIDGRYPLRFRVLLLDSLLALMAHARGPNGQSWVQLRVQLWLRELKRMVATVAPKPELVHSDDLDSNDGDHHLPVVHCRDCGATGWTSTLLNQNASQLNAARNLRDFYRSFFSRDPLIRYVFPLRAVPAGPGLGQPLAGEERLFCLDCLTIQDPPASRSTPLHATPCCQSCSSTNLLVVEVPPVTKRDHDNHLHSSSDCPYCGAHQSLLLIGASAASLTSTWASCLFASSYNTDRKLLTFSDSVQDAAHRAGFIAARAYRTSFRTALTRTVLDHTVQNSPAAIDLSALHGVFLHHWRQQLPDPVDFVATFLPADLEWIKEWAELVQSAQPVLAPDSPLLEIVEKRLLWELMAEFGYRSRLGSSVEQAGVLAAAVNPEPLDALIPPLLEQLRNDLEPLRQLTEAALRRFLQGWLQHLRQRGALPVPEMLMPSGGVSQYITSGGSKTYSFWLVRHLPNLGPSSNKPIFLTSSRGKGNFEQLASLKGRPTWAMGWLAKTLGLPPPESEAAEWMALALQALVSALEAGGILQPMPTGQRDEQIWALNPSAVQVTAQVASLRCSHCGDGQTIPLAQHDSWQQMPCLVNGCQGHYLLDGQGGLPLYRRLYGAGQVHRIIAREHTGLLTRQDRERLETQFIHDGPRSHPNLLSATSTLEMGINIGDLSTVLLCSVPPEPANYLQRIGRAGRRDGNALVAAIVNGTPHDLFFYGEPSEMLQGRVSPPGCYLDAGAILSRQLVAFTLDRWVLSGITSEALPRRLKAALDAVEHTDWEVKRKRFPFTWLEWTRNHQHTLADDFLALFDQDTVKEPCRQQLRQHLLAEGDAAPEFHQQLVLRLEALGAERRRLSNEGKRLAKRSRHLAAIPADSLLEAQKEEKEEVLRELKAYAALRRDLENRRLLEMLTDEGFLPNYAFPEAGVTLKSVLWRRLTRKPQAGRTSEDLPPLSYERPGSVAIRELVPDGVFYAQGRRVQIDQIDLALNPIERWRFCRACSFSCQEGEQGFQQATCPRCGDANFCDAHQVKEMAKLRQVIATSEDALTRIGDDRDDRTTTYFQRQLLIQPDLNRVETTLAIDDAEFPFGAEFIGSTTFREINFGALNPVGSGHQIAGQQFRVRGFEICSGCGKVLSGPPKAKQHAYSCRYRDTPDNAKARKLLFMYREFQSEALRFLLPDRLFWDESGQSSFQAALRLGLKTHFSGKVDHLQPSVASEPQSPTAPGQSPGGPNNQRKTFLYLYDSIPGGSGYLRQLVEHGGERLRQVFEAARTVMQACPCNDGCYRCLFAYRSRYERDRISKSRALEQLQTLLSRWEQLQSSQRSLTAITITSQVESELEDRFLDALREGRGAPSEFTVKLTADTVRGSTAYHLRVNQANWIIQPQVLLGRERDIDEPSRCDFLITPTTGGLPIALYTDGWDYHRSRLPIDVRQRMALQRSGRYRFWGLCWDDVVGRANGPADPLPVNGLLQGLVPPFRRDPGAFAEQWLARSRFPSADLPAAGEPDLLPRDLRWMQETNSFQHLLAYLSLPSEASRTTAWEGLAHTFCLAQMGQDLSRSLPEDIQAPLDSLGLNDHLQQWRPERENGQAGQWLEQGPGFAVLTCIDLPGHMAHFHDASFRALHYDPEAPASDSDQQQGWREWLRQANLFQFLPHMLLTTPGCTGTELGSDVLPKSPTTARDTTIGGTVEAPLPSAAWSESLSFANSHAKDCLDLLTALQSLLDPSGIEPPEFGYELEGPRGESCDELEMAWPGYQVAVVLDDRVESPPDGWRLFPIHSPAEVVAAAIQS